MAGSSQRTSTGIGATAGAPSSSRVNQDGTVSDVCSGTGAGPTKEYYLNRPVVNGADDRGGAMALLAAMEMEELARRN